MTVEIMNFHSKTKKNLRFDWRSGLGFPSFIYGNDHNLVDGQDLKDYYNL